jgi:hypothetical protein
MAESHSVRKNKQPTYQVKINLLEKHFLVDACKVKKKCKNISCSKRCIELKSSSFILFLNNSEIQKDAPLMVQSWAGNNGNIDITNLQVKG